MRPDRSHADTGTTERTSRSIGWLQDLQYAWRVTMRSPAPSLLVVATMALGLTAVIVLASVAYSVLLRPLPWADAPRLVRLYETREGSTNRFRPLLTNAAYLAWQTPAPETLDALGAWSRQNVIVRESDEPRQVAAGLITPGLFEMLGARPAVGRTFRSGEELPGQPRIAILSHGFWHRHFGGAPDIIGQSLQLDGDLYEVVGVMPAGFAFPDREVQLWLPFHVRPVNTPGVPGTNLMLMQALGRLREGATAAQASAEGTARGQAAAPDGPVVMAVFGSNGAVRVSAVPMIDALVGDVRAPLLLMIAAVVLLLVIAVANIASLQLARAATRRREFAVRVALGAKRSRLLRQVFVENLVLGLVSGVIAVILAGAVHQVLPTLLPADFPRLDDIVFDLRIQVLGVLLAVVGAVVFALPSALQAGRRDVLPMLAEDALAPVGGGYRTPIARMRAGIMIAQVAMACVLLVGATLLIRSFVRLTEAPLGYDASNLLIARVVLPANVYKTEQWGPIMEDIASRVRQAPGVRGVAYTTTVPFGSSVSVSSFPLKTREGTTVQVQTGMNAVSAGYFAALGQRVVEGRDFTESDNGTAQPVAIVNREFSRRYLNNQALGWTLAGSQGEPEIEIVGVVDDVARRSVNDPPLPEVYRPALQRPAQVGTTLVVRSTASVDLLASQVRTATREVAPHAPLESIRTMEDMVSSTLARPRLYGVLLGTFAGAALLIAGVGLFSVLSYSVAQRRREIAVRAALGAEPRDVVSLVARQTAAIVGTGVALGLTVAFWTAAVLESQLYGVTPTDVTSFVTVAVILVAVGLFASIVPARRAARVEPARVLKTGY